MPGNICVARSTGSGTYGRERVPAHGCTPENDVGVVILVNAEEALKSRLVTKTMGVHQTKIMSVSVVGRLPWRVCHKLTVALFCTASRAFDG